MRRPRNPALLRLGSAAVVLLALAACTPGGQFDPTTLLDNDMFGAKKKLAGPREPVFPNGVPGTTSGVPPDLVKGYQPPPEPADSAGATPPPGAEPAKTEAARAEPAAKPKVKVKPRPKVARAPRTTPTHVSVGLGQRPSGASQQTQPQAAWPAPPPATPQTAQQSQSVWPNPPPTGSGQQASQPAQSVWPSPPPMRPTQ